MGRILLLVLCLAVATVVGCNSANVRTDDNEISLSELHLLHNKERGKRKLPQLDSDPDLDKAAQAWAERMAARRSLTHSRLGGTKFSSMGENIAMGQPDEESVLHDWMNSPGHRRNILNRRYTHAGFGYAKAANGTPYWCVQFGGN